MKLSFTKMHGCGNNYIYINCFDQKVTDPEKLSIALSEPHFGIGGDGIILISPSDRADAQMRIFNADGSEGKMCGNGIRCVGKYLYDNGMVGGRTTITIDTLSGVKTLELTVKDGKVTAKIVWSSKNYDYMKVGDTKYDAVIEDEHSTFEIPVSCFDWAMAVKADTTAMSEAHEIDYTLTFDSASVAPLSK